jgi:hypothetical protein
LGICFRFRPVTDRLRCRFPHALEITRNWSWKRVGPGASEHRGALVYPRHEECLVRASSNVETAKALGLCACSLAAMFKLSAAQSSACSCTSPWLAPWPRVLVETRSMVLIRWRHSPHPAWIDGQCGPTLLHVALTIWSDAKACRAGGGLPLGSPSASVRWTACDLLINKIIRKKQY